MAAKVTNTDRYPATPSQLMEMMRTRAYWSEKYEEFGARDLDFEEFDTRGDGVTIRTTRIVPNDVPGFAKKIVGDTTVVHQTEIWTADGDGYACDFEVNIDKVPGGMSGWMKLTPVGDGETDWSLRYDVKVNIPLVGGKLEGVMKGETEHDLEREFTFNSAWLAAH